MSTGEYDIVVTPLGGEPETVRAVGHRYNTEPEGQVCLITTASGDDRRYPLAEYWIDENPD